VLGSGLRHGVPGAVWLGTCTARSYVGGIAALASVLYMCGRPLLKHLPHGRGSGIKCPKDKRCWIRSTLDPIVILSAAEPFSRDGSAESKDLYITKPSLKRKRPIAQDDGSTPTV